MHGAATFDVQEGGDHYRVQMDSASSHVLIEGHGRHPGQLVGKSPWLQAVHVNAPTERIGTILPVRIEAIGANTLSGALMDRTSGRPLERAFA